MAVTAKKIDVWVGDIRDHPGGLLNKLEPLAEAGADLTFIVARRQIERPGRGLVLLGPLKGAKQQKAATASGFYKPEGLAAVHLEGPNKPGSAAAAIRAIADAGISLNSLQAATIGGKFMLVLAFDSDEDADLAVKLVKAAGKKKR
jgi:ACT domain-containing protein